ncbi:hypothetical protein Acr_02g0013380 [Actinidia rufa]|uniref:Uncharacterized protein n=1 Tax=Actinidia rufa TaxID=165716 RepID=A0A7J0E9F4_9ERIC|nr:hypothetical protein Acr_02g0013380 [Actinidia rufa]
MASTTTAKFSYQRLRHEGGFSDDEDHDLRERVIGRAKSWPKIRKVRIKKRLRVRIPSLRRFLKRKAGAICVTWAKIVKRLKESQGHFGDLFAGNYLFLQVTPTPLKDLYRHHHELHGLSSRYSLPRVAQ